MLVSSDVPVDLDWDFAGGVVNVVAAKPTTLRLSLKAAGRAADGWRSRCKADAQGGALQRSRCPRGVTCSPARRLPPESRARDSRPHLQRLLAEGRKLRDEALAAAGPRAKPDGCGVAGRR